MSHEQFEVACDAPMKVGECPVWSADEAALYWVDIDGFAVHRLDPASGAHRTWRMDSEPSAIALNRGGGLVVALRSGFAHLDTGSGAVTGIVPAPYDMSKVRFNDGCVDPAGRFWVGTLYEPRDQQAAEMYVLERGRLTLAWSGGMTVSNGLAFSPDQRTMYHSDTTSHRIDCYDFNAAGGTASQARRFQQFDTDKKAPGYGGRPDGATVDSEGAYWSAMFEGGRLLRFAPDGTLLRELALPVRCPTMMAFGGADLRTLYITSASHGRPAAELEHYPLTGRVLSLRVDVPGRLPTAYLP